MPGACENSQSIESGLEPYFVTLADMAMAGRLAVYAGAGIGRSAPTDMPDSARILADAEPKIRIELGLEVKYADGVQKTLEVIADEAEANGPAALEALKAILATDDRLIRRPPSCAHLGLALLVADDLVTVFTVNWDTCFERAGAELGHALEPSKTAEDRRARWRVALNKIMGCATSASTLRVSTAEVSSPEAWAVAQVSEFANAGSIVFVGIGTVPEQLKALITTAVAAAPASIHAVGPTLGDPWPELLVAAPEQRHMTTANAFVDGLQRAVARRALADAVVATATAVAGEPPRAGWSASAERLAAALGRLSAMPVLMWLKAGGGGITPGRHVIGSVESSGCLVALAGLAEGRRIEVEARGDRATVSVDDAYIEFAIWPGESARQVISAEEARTERLRANGAFTRLGSAIVHLVHGHRGALPAGILTNDLIGGLDPANVVDAGAGAPHFWIPVDTYLQGTYQVTSWPN